MCKPVMKVLKSIAKNNVSIQSKKHNDLLLTCGKCYRTYEFTYSYERRSYVIKRWYYLKETLNRAMYPHLFY